MIWIFAAWLTLMSRTFTSPGNKDQFIFWRLLDRVANAEATRNEEWLTKVSTDFGH